MPIYPLNRSAVTPDLSLDWESLAWRDVPALSIDRFHPDSVTQFPRTLAKLVLAGRALHVIFQTHDECVRSVATEYQDPVSRDSCVELFIEPRPHHGYFNFEWSCGGVMLLFHIVDPTREEGVFRRFTPVRDEHAAMVQVATSMPRTSPIEIPGPVRWTLRAQIPLEVMEHYVGPIEVEPGTCWRANFFKCASETSRPHWASWSDLGAKLDFHQPDRFGILRLQPESQANHLTL